MEESHDKRGEIGEKFQLIFSEDRDVLKDIIANHCSISCITHCLCRVVQVIIKVSVEVSPLEEGHLREPDIQNSIITVCGICSIAVRIRSLQESTSVILSHLEVSWVSVLSENISEDTPVTETLMQLWLCPLFLLPVLYSALERSIEVKYTVFFL